MITKACAGAASRFVPPDRSLHPMVWQPHGSGSGVKNRFQIRRKRAAPGPGWAELDHEHAGELGVGDRRPFDDQPPSLTSSMEHASELGTLASLLTWPASSAAPVIAAAQVAGRRAHARPRARWPAAELDQEPAGELRPRGDRRRPGCRPPSLTRSQPASSARRAIVALNTGSATCAVYPDPGASL